MPLTACAAPTCPRWATVYALDRRYRHPERVPTCPWCLDRVQRDLDARRAPSTPPAARYVASPPRHRPVRKPKDKTAPLHWRDSVSWQSDAYDETRQCKRTGRPRPCHCCGGSILRGQAYHRGPRRVGGCPEIHAGCRVLLVLGSQPATAAK